MTAAIDKLNRARAAIVDGRPAEALNIIESFVRAIEDDRIDSDQRDRIEAMLIELRTLAQAAQSGAQAAMDQIADIIQAAQSLRTYDSAGRRQVATITTEAPRRF
ncbi:MAG: hypothetical protein Q4G14_07055 [Paracoccus sp. (in: a-proteobacteria)]|uniref:hypothetical protein n=1 Tax=Paracoccus sp. TaxID=267 RepID=UPI0026DEC54F|nr:hypothetical protein [Paracoccus sp. (in: a-proteobacteria)]MDO5612985.1 hypothetical protein [Paracoccus sp. (in: a-proteobacteria)]